MRFLETNLGSTSQTLTEYKPHTRACWIAGLSRWQPIFFCGSQAHSFTPFSKGLDASCRRCGAQTMRARHKQLFHYYIVQGCRTLFQGIGMETWNIPSGEWKQWKQCKCVKLTRSRIPEFKSKPTKSKGFDQSYSNLMNLCLMISHILFDVHACHEWSSQSFCKQRGRVKKLWYDRRTTNAVYLFPGGPQMIAQIKPSSSSLHEYIMRLCCRDHTCRLIFVALASACKLSLPSSLWPLPEETHTSKLLA